MVDALQSLGVSCATDHGRPPIVVRGPLEGGHIVVDASLSSQFLTGLLMALPLCGKNSRVSVSQAHERPLRTHDAGALGRLRGDHRA